jgi:hypothetical protein
MNAADLLGLEATSGSCTPEHVKQTQDAVTEMCNKILTPSVLKCCDMDRDVMQKLRKICSPTYAITIHCGHDGDDGCRGGECASTDQDSRIAGTQPDRGHPLAIQPARRPEGVNNLTGRARLAKEGAVWFRRKSRPVGPWCGF